MKKTIIIIIVLVVILAVVAYFGIRSVKKASETTITDYDPTPGKNSGGTNAGSTGASVEGNDRATGSGLTLNLIKEKYTFTFVSADKVKKLQNYFKTLDSTKNEVGTVDGIIGPKFCKCVKILLEEGKTAAQVAAAAGITKDDFTTTKYE